MMNGGSYHHTNEKQSPTKPPPARFIDTHGAPWIIDDRFLALLDDLIERLQKWLEV
jgi:hypothetical protein